MVSQAEIEAHAVKIRNYTYFTALATLDRAIACAKKTDVPIVDRLNNLQIINKLYKKALLELTAMLKIVGG